MFINFNEVDVLESVGIDYFSYNTKGLKNLSDTGWSELYNQWLSFKGSSNGADVRCTIVHLGKKLSGNMNRLRIAVYETENRFETLSLFPMNRIKEAIEMMSAMASYGELVCCE